MTVVALSGGVGGAKLASGLQDILEPGELVVVSNTGDDFEHLGLHISPDIDSVFYALAGLNDEERGWGRAGETWRWVDHTPDHEALVVSLDADAVVWADD